MANRAGYPGTQPTTDSAIMVQEPRPADLGYVYNLWPNHMFIEHKCNFRIDLMYYKSLLITPKLWESLLCVSKRL